MHWKSSIQNIYSKSKNDTIIGLRRQWEESTKLARVGQADVSGLSVPPMQVSISLGSMVKGFS